MIFGVILDIIAASFIEFPVSSEVCFIFRIFNVVHVFPDFLLCTCYIPDTCLTDITVKLTVDKPAVIIRTSYVEKPVTIACTGKTFLFAVGKFYFGEFAVAIVSASALFFSIDVENNCLVAMSYVSARWYHSFSFSNLALLASGNFPAGVCICNC